MRTRRGTGGRSHQKWEPYNDRHADRVVLAQFKTLGRTFDYREIPFAQQVVPHLRALPQIITGFAGRDDARLNIALRAHHIVVVSVNGLKLAMPFFNIGRHRGAEGLTFLASIGPLR